MSTNMMSMMTSTTRHSVMSVQGVKTNKTSDNKNIEAHGNFMVAPIVSSES